MKTGVVIFVIITVCAAFAGALIWTLESPGNPAAGITLTVVCIGEVPLIMLAVFHGLWRPVARNYPARPHGEGAITKKFQSFGLGIINMSLSIHATVDDRHLHLLPVTWLRWFGASPMSIPWEDMQPKGSSGRVVRLAKGPTLGGPKWCFTMAQVDAEEAHSD